MQDLPQLFQDSFASAATTRRNIASAKKIAVEAIKGGDHQEFCGAFKDCVLVLLTAKKGTAGFDKVLKFIRGFLDLCQSNVQCLFKPINKA